MHSTSYAAISGEEMTTMSGIDRSNDVVWLIVYYKWHIILYIHSFSQKETLNVEGPCDSHHDEQRYKCTVWEASVNIAILRKIKVQEGQMVMNWHTVMWVAMFCFRVYHVYTIVEYSHDAKMSTVVDWS